MLDRAGDMVISGGFTSRQTATQPCAVVWVKAEASVTEKDLVELCAVHLGN